MKRLAMYACILGTILINTGPLFARERGAVAAIYYWKAKPGKLEEYNRYIREVAEPIDGEAKRRRAFISVTTYMSQKADSPWTHMRIFVLKDRVQLENLLKARTDKPGRWRGGNGRRPDCRHFCGEQPSRLVRFKIRLS